MTPDRTNTPERAVSTMLASLRSSSGTCERTSIQNSKRNNVRKSSPVTWTDSK